MGGDGGPAAPDDGGVRSDLACRSDCPPCANDEVCFGKGGDQEATCLKMCNGAAPGCPVNTDCVALSALIGPVPQSAVCVGTAVPRGCPGRTPFPNWHCDFFGPGLCF